MTISVDRAGLWDAEALADVAAVTFPLACPPHATKEDIAAFIDEVLSAEKFSEYLTDPTRTVLKATTGGEIVGYVMLVDGTPEDDDIRAALSLLPTTEISKLYVLPPARIGVSAALMDAGRSCPQRELRRRVARRQPGERAGAAVLRQERLREGRNQEDVSGRRPDHHDFVMQRSL